MYPTPAIVIGRLNLGEADRILTLLTPDYGKLRVSIRGVRKIKSRLAGHVELFSQTRLMLAKGILISCTKAPLICFTIFDRSNATAA